MPKSKPTQGSKPKIPASKSSVPEYVDPDKTTRPIRIGIVKKNSPDPEPIDRVGTYRIKPPR